MSKLILNLDNLTQQYKLKLAQLNEVEIGELTVYSDFTYTPALTEISELSFSMPSVYTNDWGNRAKTPYYDELQADTLIIVNDTEYYYVDTCPETTQDGYSTKSVHAYSREYELSFKSFDNYNPETERFLYFYYPTETKSGFPWATVAEIPLELKDHITNTVDKDGYYYGIFNELVALTRWRLADTGPRKPIIPKVRIEEDDPRKSIATQVRKITTSESNLLELMKQIQEAWNVYFEYNTKDRIITIKAIEDLLENDDGTLKPAIGVLSNENFIIDLTKESKNQDIKTRLYLYNLNGDGVVSRLTGHGQSYIEDYTYYQNPKYMSQYLLDALLSYKNQIDIAAPTTKTLFNAYQDLVDEKILVEEEIAYLNEELARAIARLDPLKILKEGYKSGDEVILEPGTLSPEQQTEYNLLTKRVAAINKEIVLRTTSISAVRPTGNYFKVKVPAGEGEAADADGLKEITLKGRYFSLKKLATLITAKQKEIKAHQKLNEMRKFLLDYETNNSLPQYSLVNEMEPYIKEASYKSDSIEDAVELLNLGKKLIRNVSQPKMEFSLNVLDFLSLVELSNAWHLISRGSILKIKNTDLSFDKDALLLKYTHSPASQSLTLYFSEDLTISSDTKFIANLIAKSSTIASQVSFNSNYWASGGAVGRGSDGGGGVISNYFDMLYAKEIQTGKLIADEIEATKIEVGLLIADEIEATKITVQDLIADNIEAEVIRTEELYAKTAEIESLIADEIDAEVVRTEELYAKTAEIDNLVAGVITADSVTTELLKANYADIDLANIETGIINTVLSEDLLATDGFINNLKVLSGQMVSLDASKITAGTLSAERILITGGDPNNPNAKPLLLTLNNLGELVSENVDSLDGYLLTNNTVHAEKLIAESITAREIAAGAITANKILAGSITSASGLIADLDAGDITTGTLDASRVAITNLTADSIVAGELRSLNDMFYLDMITGYFDIGGVLTHDARGVSIKLGGVPAEDYIADRTPHQIYAFPSQIMLSTSSEGKVTSTQSFEIEIPVYEGGQMQPATITGIYLKGSSGQTITSTDFSSSVINPTSTTPGKLETIFSNGFNPNTDNGTVNMTIRVGTRQYFYSVGWTKNKKLPDNYSVQIVSSAGESFKNGNISTILSAIVYKDSEEYDPDGTLLNYVWSRQSGNPAGDSAWGVNKIGAGKNITITSGDLTNSATFFCEVSL